MSMGVWDSMKDWASKKLASSEFVTYVDQATNEQLLAPNYDMFMVLVDAANDPKGEWVADVVRSVRIRLDNPNPKVKLFTLELVSVLVQNCGLKFHTEMAEAKGLLNAIVETACLRQDLVRGPLAEARKAAIQLIVNLDVWFKHHPARDKVGALADLFGEAKGRNAVFENVIPDTTTRIITEKFARRSTAAETAQSGQAIMSTGNLNRTAAAAPGGASATGARNRDDAGDFYAVDQRPTAAQQRAAYLRQQQQQAGMGNYAARGAPALRDEVVIVEAIPCEEPNEERRAGMFEAVMLLGECFHAAKAANESIANNEMITSVAQQVREDFLFVSMLVNSGAILQQADTLGSLYESQRTVLREVKEAVEGRPGTTTTTTNSASAAPPRPPASTGAAPTSSSIVTGSTHPALHQPPAQPPAGKSAAPTLDELFALSAPSAPATAGAGAKKPPGNAIDSLFSPTVAMPAGVQTGTVGGSSSGDGSTTARRQAMSQDPMPRQNMSHGQRNNGGADAGFVDVELHSPKEGGDSNPPPPPPPASAPPTTQSPATRGASGARVAADTGDGGDFDAFLNARLGGSVQ